MRPNLTQPTHRLEKKDTLRGILFLRLQAGHLRPKKKKGTLYSAQRLCEHARRGKEKKVKKKINTCFLLFIFVEYFRHYRQDPARLPTTQDSSYLSLQQVSQDRAQELFARHLTRPYQGVSRIDFFVLSLDSSG